MDLITDKAQSTVPITLNFILALSNVGFAGFSGLKQCFVVVDTSSVCSAACLYILHQRV